MQLKTILNRVESFKSFVYGKIRWVEGTGRPTLEVEVLARKNGRPICSGCGRPRPGYDRLPERRFEFVPYHEEDERGDRRGSPQRGPTTGEGVNSCSTTCRAFAAI